jgi:hypothetical protein
LTNGVIESEGWGLVLEFPDQSASFTSGFEAGRLWHQMQVETGIISRAVNSANREIIVRMCGALGWSVEFEHLSPGWLQARLERNLKPSLRVVENNKDCES